MNFKSESGFSPLENLLLIIGGLVVLVIGLVIYNANNNASSTLDKANKETSSQTKIIDYMTIKELGIKIPRSSDMKDVSYVYSKQGTKTALLTDQSFTNAVSACDPTDTKSHYFGAIFRYEGTYKPNKPPVNMFAGFIKQFKGYFIEYGNPDGGYCTNANKDQMAKVTNVLKKLNTATIKSLKSAKAID